MLDLSKLSDNELLQLREKTSQDIATYKVLQNALKVTLNSAYGALGSEYFRFYNTAQAEAVTVSGQLVIKWIEIGLNKYLNQSLKTEGKDYVLAMDTDSCYLNLEDLVKKVYKDEITDKKKVINFLDKFCAKYLQPQINDICEEIADYLNVFKNCLTMKRESIADRGIWTAKKHYILNVHDSEGVKYEKAKIKIKGIEAVKSSTPQYCRDKIKEGIKIILNEKEKDVQDFISKIEKEFSTMKIEQVSFPRSCNGLEEYYDPTGFKKGTPIQVRGALVYNKLIKEKKLERLYPLIKSGDKVKFFYLKEPNPTFSHVIAILDELPKELNLENYIDYDIQFNKAFKEPLKTILDAIGWKAEHTNNLLAFLVDD